MPALKKYAFVIIFVLLVWGSARSAAAETPQDFLQSLASKTTSIQSISSHFTQEKTLAVMQESLRSEGRFCLRKTANSAAQVDLLLWEYTSPASSGFVLNQNKASLWTKDKSRIRPVNAQENSLLQIISSHILEWININVANIEMRYHVRYDPEQAHSIRLEPKKQGGYFRAIEAQFAPDRTHLQSLTFTEQNGDSMRILFSDIRMNTSLPAFCTP